MREDKIIKDSIHNGWVEHMPAGLRPYLRLSRYDRPIGFWLLGLPGLVGLALASLSYGLGLEDVKWAALIAVGAVAMRGAGCTYNDIVDRELDAKVERTALRPLPAGTVNLKQAWGWLIFQCLIGLAVLSFFPRLSQITAIASLVLVAAYPFMKRITFWPQAWLGLTFNWAILVTYSAITDTISLGVNIVYLGLVFWTIGYDTIYACQDVEDDALIGVKSTARLFGNRTHIGVGSLYAICALLLALGVVVETHQPLVGFLVLPFAGHLFWQTRSLEPDNNVLCLSLFKSNRLAGLLLIISLSLLALAKLLSAVT